MDITGKIGALLPESVSGSMWFAVILFVVGLVFLIKGGDWFVDGATAFAKRLKVPELIIGATVVSIGTTLPEVMVSATSAVTGHGDMAYGNAIGSVICNTALIAALTIAIKPGKVDRRTFIIPVCFFFGAAAFYSFVAYFFGDFSRVVGILLLCIFIAYMAVLIIREVRAKKNGTTLPSDEKEPEEDTGSAMPVWKMILFLVIGAVLIAAGADLLVDNGTVIAVGLGVPESVVALTFVALGTSLPELVTAITSLAKGHGSLSLGNIIGANLFNLVLVCGVSTTLGPFKVPSGNTIFGISTSLLVEIPLMIIVMAIMCIPALVRQKLSRFQGILLLCLYAGFVVFQFMA